MEAQMEPGYPWKPLKAVSYTHLDVYKRQVLRLLHLAGRPLPFPGGKGLPSAVAGVEAA